MAKSQSLNPEERIEKSILLIRGHKILLDHDLADLYGVETKNLNKAVQRNVNRFPDDFMFQLTADKQATLRFQSGTLKTGRGQHRKYLPYAFTELGVAMNGWPHRSLPRRNRDRFPEDFMFRLTATELQNLMSQIATSSPRYGKRRECRTRAGDFSFNRRGDSIGERHACTDCLRRAEAD